MTRSRILAGAATATVMAFSLMGLAQEQKKNTGPTIDGMITGLSAGYKYKNDDGEVVLEGTKVDIKRTKAKKGVGNVFVVVNKETKIIYETKDKELAVGQYAKVWFDEGDKDPSKQGQAIKIIIAEAPKKKKN